MSIITQDEQKAPEYLPIGEAAQRTGVTQRTLRYYEEIGLLPAPVRMSGGQRLYGPDDLRRIEQIMRMKNLLNFSLHEIKAAVEAEETRQNLCGNLKRERNPKRRQEKLRQTVEVMTRQLRVVDEKIQQLQALKQELERDLVVLDEKIGRAQEGNQATT